jgi:hydroxymethylglutaryl-CoA reductase
MKQAVTGIKGFSKKTKDEKIQWVIENYMEDPDEALKLIKSYNHPSKNIQKIHDEFIENAISNYYLPFGVAPNFLINGKMYCLPMAIEESSVVAAMAKSANFWMNRGGFQADVVSTKKVGHVHFVWRGSNKEELQALFDRTKPMLWSETEAITANMRKRGGGILSAELVDKSDLEPNYWQIKGEFETCDSMGANFINTILEKWADVLKREAEYAPELTDHYLDVIMCILSNFTPECLVRAEVSCPVSELKESEDYTAEEFANKFLRAVHVAEIEPYRAVTHNKGIMNGIDAMIIATGNDFRATEACAHAYAAKDGQYRSLSHASIENDIFRFYIEVPLALGTVGGITTLHPMVKFARELLGNPNSTELMKIIASAGLAQNFSALRSLTTTGIQKGHMKMHLLNVLNQLGATEAEKAKLVHYFKDKVPSHQGIVEAYQALKSGKI